jgi:hypothetical protein
VTFSLHWALGQGDQKIGKKIAQILGKVAKTIAKLKNAKVFSSKLNWKVQNVFINPLLNSLNTCNKRYFYQKKSWAFKKIAQMMKFRPIWSPCPGVNFTNI